jgi:hypothetical protein
MFMAAINIVILGVDLSEVHLPWIAENAMTNLGNILLAGLPISVAIAILRYRLYDIDIIIRRTIVYAVLTLTLALIYYLAVVILQTAVGLAVEDQSPYIIVVSTLLIAALFSPLRRQIQRFIDRRFYRRKYDATQTLELFAISARDEVTLETLMAEIVEILQDTFQPTNISFLDLEGKKIEN